MNTFFSFGQKVAAVIFVVALMVAPASATLIDDFSTDQDTIVLTTGTDTNTASGAGILGGYRDITLSILVAPDNGALPQATAGVAGGTLNISNGFDLTSETVVAWDGEGVGGAALGLGAAGDLSTSFAILVNVVFADLGADIEFELTDAANNVATASQSIGPGSGIYSFGFGSFVGDSIDTSALKAIKMTITGPAAFDLQVDIVETAVPEPSTMLLSGLALLALGGLARRRSAKKA